MAALDRRTGGAHVVRFTPQGGSAQVITADYTKFNDNRKLDTVDVTAGSETSRTSKPTVEGMDFSLSIYGANQSWLVNVLPRVQGVLEIMEDGIGVGLPIVEFTALLTDFSRNVAFDGAVEIEIKGMRQGAMSKEVGSVQA